MKRWWEVSIWDKSATVNHDEEEHVTRGGVKNESNSLYISTSYYDRINFDTCPRRTSISARILMLGIHARRLHEWNKKRMARLREKVAAARNRNRASTKPLHLCRCVRVCEARIRLEWPRLQRVVVIWMKEECWKSLDRLRYRRPVRVIKVSLSESVPWLNKIFRWTEFKVTLEENDMEAARVGHRIEIASSRSGSRY